MIRLIVLTTIVAAILPAHAGEWRERPSRPITVFSYHCRYWVWARPCDAQLGRCGGYTRRCIRNPVWR